MASSLDLQREFQALCKNVYFQPPESVKLSYPCIIYKRSAGDTRFADNKKYSYTAGYDVVVVETDPDRSWRQMCICTSSTAERGLLMSQTTFIIVRLLSISKEE